MKKQQQFDFIFDKAAAKYMEWSDRGRTEIGRSWQSPDGKTKRIYFRTAVRANRREAFVLDQNSSEATIDEIARQWGWVDPQPEPAAAADTNSDLIAIIAADDADAADEAAMRATYAPAADTNSDLTAIIEAGEPGGLVWDSSGHLARYTADGMAYNRLNATEIGTVSADEYVAFSAAHAAESPNEWQPTWEEMQDRAQMGETPSAVNWY